MKYPLYYRLWDNNPTIISLSLPGGWVRESHIIHEPQQTVPSYYLLHIQCANLKMHAIIINNLQLLCICHFDCSQSQYTLSSFNSLNPKYFYTVHCAGQFFHIFRVNCVIHATGTFCKWMTFSVDHYSAQRQQVKKQQKWCILLIFLLIHGQYTHTFTECWKLFAHLGDNFYIDTKQSIGSYDKTRTINRKHCRATAKPAACAKPLMLSTLWRKGKREGRWKEGGRKGRNGERGRWGR